jgi:hypothetical protein
LTQETEVRNTFDLFREVAGCLDIIEVLYDAYSEKGGGLQIGGIRDARPRLRWKRRTAIGVERGLCLLQHKGWVEEGPDGVWKLRHERVLQIDAMNAGLRDAAHLMESGRPRD